MVNPRRIKTNLPSLLLDTGTANAQAEFMKKRNHLHRFAIRNPKKCEELLTKLCLCLREIDRAVEECT